MYVSFRAALVERAVQSGALMQQRAPEEVARSHPRLRPVRQNYSDCAVMNAQGALGNTGHCAGPAPCVDLPGRSMEGSKVRATSPGVHPLGNNTLNSKTLQVKHLCRVHTCFICGSKRLHDHAGGVGGAFWRGALTLSGRFFKAWMSGYKIYHPHPDVHDADLSAGVLQAGVVVGQEEVN